MIIQQKVASNEKIHMWKTGLIGQANGSKVMYLTVDPNAALLKVNLYLYIECYIR